MINTKDAPSPKELRKKARQRFAVAKRMEADYLRSLRGLTKQIDHIVKGMAPKGVVKDVSAITSVLNQYAETIRPWARSVAEQMVTRIAKLDENAWVQMGNEMGRSMREELQDAPTGQVLKDFLNEQVRLITSLPIEAGQRVHKLTTEALVSGRRAEDIAKEILETGKVTESRARLIARTEVARTASGLTMARALHVGCTHYIWRTSGDSDVRLAHKQMNAKVIPWNEPPTLSDGTTTHAGMIYNCRCYPEPVLTDD